jgi:hypothetical protein
MKKTALILVLATLFFSCGKEKNTDQENSEVITEEIKKNEFSVIMNAIYEKNDTVKLFVYDEIGNEYLDKVVKVPVVGSPLSQSILINFPNNVDIYNIAIGFSTNKDQDAFTLKSITMKQGEEELITPSNFLYFFANNDQMVLNIETGKHQLIHDKVYPPAFGGNDKLKALLQ